MRIGRCDNAAVETSNGWLDATNGQRVLDICAVEVVANTGLDCNPVFRPDDRWNVLIATCSSGQDTQKPEQLSILKTSFWDTVPLDSALQITHFLVFLATSLDGIPQTEFTL